MQMNEFFYGGNGKPHWQAMGGDRQRNSYGRTVPTYEFRVPMCCSKCEEKVREELSELDGVFEVLVDQLSELVAVTGFMDPFQALKKMKRIKKKSEFWDSSSPTLKSSHRSLGHHSSKKLSLYKHHPKTHETVYRSSYNRAPSRASTSRHYASYDDGMPYSDQYDPSHRTNYGAYDDGAVAFRTNYNSYGNGVCYRNKHGAYDDGLVSYKNGKYGAYGDGVSYRSKFHGAYDDGALTYRNETYGAYDDGAVSYRPSKYNGGYGDGVTSYSDLRPSSSSVPFSGLPRNRVPVRYEYITVPPYAQDYYTEDYVEDYPSVYNRY